MIFRIFLTCALLVSLSACNRGPGNGRPLINLRGAAVAPDEFLVVPQKPLETPANLTALPVPEPGATSRTEIDFEGNLLAALGGRSTKTSSAADAALVRAAQAGGVTPDIRAVLQAEDQVYRESRASRIEKLAREREAVRIYDDFLLDPLAELNRLRALGVKTPPVPPS